NEDEGESPALCAGADPRELRLHPDRLPAVIEPPDHQRPGRRRWRDHSHAVRVLVARRAVGPGQQHSTHRPAAQPQAADPRHVAPHVRSAHQPDQRRQRPAQAALWRQAVRRRDPPQRAPGRGPELRHAGAGVRQTIPWRHRLSGAGRRTGAPPARQRQNRYRLRNTRMAAKKRGLGRGLDALLGGTNVNALQEEAAQADSRELQYVPLDLIQRGKYQPRRDMDQTALEELAASIRAQGVMQPIVLRPIDGGRFEIVAGERRWRASQLAGLDKIPARVRELPDEAAIAMALIENIQREDLNPIEEAFALQRLQQEFELTQQQVADAVGKSRVTVTNLLRLI